MEISQWIASSKLADNQCTKYLYGALESLYNQFMMFYRSKNRGSVAAGVLVLVPLILCFMAGAAMGTSLSLSKRAAEYEVTITLDRNPPILGINNLEVNIRGADGASITDAKVLVNYYMPPMPRMAPMNYRVDAPFRGGKYRVAMNFIMEGPWVIVVKINHQGKAASAKFNVNVP